MLYLSRSPDDAFHPFRNVHPAFPPWHDATPGACPFILTILDTLRGLHKAMECGFFDFAKFNIEEYEHYEQVENGDLNWTLQNKFIAFAGPHAARESHPGGYTSLCPDDYISYFKRRNVKLVVRLNKKYYDARKFTQHGINHMELYFLDGSNPPDNLLAKFLEAAETTDGAVAVHCKAGLGRTGCMVGCYIMKHYRLTAEETIGWLRICRPGSIIGPQQQWMREMQPRMWRDGDMLRAAQKGQGSGVISKSIAIESQTGAKPTASSASNAARGVTSIGIDGISSRMQNMQVSDRRAAAQSALASGTSLGPDGPRSSGSIADHKALADVAAAEEENKSQGDYLRQRRMLAAQELAAGARTIKNIHSDESPAKEAAARSPGSTGEISRFGRFFGK